MSTLLIKKTDFINSSKNTWFEKADAVRVALATPFMKFHKFINPEDIQGDSMYPMLISGRDSVVIELPVFPLKKYDVPVYRRGGHLRG